jgi:hypothetical protein
MSNSLDSHPVVLVARIIKKGGQKPEGFLGE